MKWSDDFISIKSYLESEYGLHYKDNQESNLYQKLTSAALYFKYKNVGDFIQWLNQKKQDQTFFKNFISQITIGETYFFRNASSYQYLEKEFLPKLVRERGNSKSIRIWVAGCSTGEEAYSIAILLKRCIPEISTWKITILATDINTEFLNKAKAGKYSKWSFRGLPEYFKNQYFKKGDLNDYSIDLSIRNMVTFQYHNLAKGNFPTNNLSIEKMDLILCRNVFIYLSESSRENIIDNFQKTLVENGIFMVSPVESSIIKHEKLQPFRYEQNTLFKKISIDKTRILSKANPTQTNSANRNTVSKKITKSSKVKTKLNTKKDKANVVTSSENDTAKRYNEAVISYEAGSFLKCVDILEKLLLEQEDSPPEYYRYLIKAEADCGRIEVAQKWCEKAIKLYKIDPSFYFLSSTLNQEQGNLEQAINDLQKTVYLDPKHVLAQFTLGSLKDKKDGNNKGLINYKNALNLLDEKNSTYILPDSDGITSRDLNEAINRKLNLFGTHE